MVTMNDINADSSWAEKLHQVANKYGISILANDGECIFSLKEIDNEHTEDDSIIYKFNSSKEIFEFKSIYQMDNINECDLPKILECQSDFIEVIKLINKAEILRT